MEFYFAVKQDAFQYRKPQLSPIPFRKNVPTHFSSVSNIDQTSLDAGDILCELFIGITEDLNPSSCALMQYQQQARTWFRAQQRALGVKGAKPTHLELERCCMNISAVNGNGKYDVDQSAGSNLSWYALRTRSNCEKIVAGFLEARGIQQFLPLYRVPRRWSDRVFENWIPLFRGYLFCRFDARYRTPVVSALGVVSIVSFGGIPAPIDSGEIEAIRRALGSGQNVEPYPYLREGQKIRIKKGPLQGIEGILIQRRTWRVVISVEMLQRCVAVEVDPNSVFPLEYPETQPSKDHHP